MAGYGPVRRVAATGCALGHHSAWTSQRLCPATLRGPGCRSMVRDAPEGDCHSGTSETHDRPSEIPAVQRPARPRASLLSRRTAGRSRLPAGRLVVAGDAWRPTAGWHTPGCQAHDRCAGAAAGCSASRATCDDASADCAHDCETPLPLHPAHRISARALRLALHVRQFQGILGLQPAFRRGSARRCVYRYFGRSSRPLEISGWVWADVEFRAQPVWPRQGRHLQCHHADVAGRNAGSSRRC